MISLRRRLVLSLWSALAVVGVACSAYSYWQARHDADLLLDYQMEQIAHFLASQSFVARAPLPVLPRLDENHDDEDDFVVIVTGGDGQHLYESRHDWPLSQPDWLGFREQVVGAAGYRIYSARSGALHIVVAQQLDTRREVATSAAFDAFLPVLVLIPVLGLLIGVVTQQLLKPLRSVAADVAARPALSLVPLSTARLPLEVRPLVDEINELLARLSLALSREQRFVADAAHALRTPLAALQLQADVLDGSRDETERQHRVDELRSGIRRAARLAEHLLTLARSDHVSTLNLARCDVDAALVDLCDLHHPIAAASGLHLELSARSAAAIVGDARLFEVMVSNLIENALRYSAPDGTVTVRSRAEAAQVVIDVIDDGPGLPESELEKVFERFYRVAGNLSEGSGLGLAAARSVAGIFGGTIGLANRGDRNGLVATIRLPAAETSAP